MHSLEEVRKIVEENEQQDVAEKKVMVASIAPQCLASLSAKYSLSAASSSTSSNTFIPLRAILARIRFFLKDRFGFEAVVDTTFARHVALREHRREFAQRKAASAAGGTELPMLASACPGWICYAEKTHGELLPFISRTKSPQQVAGTMIKKDKRLLRRADSANATSAPASASVYHVAVMPCYDKKLEASRADFFDEVLGSRDVDCVITTGELDRLMIEEGFDVTQPVPNEAGQQEQEDLGIPSLLDHPGSSSGGYLFDLLESSWREHVDEQERSGQPFSSTPPRINVRIVRTSDFAEYTLRSPWTGEILFRGAHCYGFRNLQNLVRKVQKQTGVRSRKGAAASSVNGKEIGGAGAGGRGMAKRGRGGGMVRRGRGGAAATIAGHADAAAGAVASADEDEARGYDYVEVMACPSGCVNGGGQIRPPTGADGTGASSGSNGISMAISSGLVESTEAQVDANTAPASAAPRLDLDPEGYSSGWSTPGAASSNNGSAMDVDPQEEAALKQGWKGTTKEWVRRVEEAYWSGSAGNEGEDDTKRGTGALVSSDGIQAALARRRKVLSDAVDALADQLVRDMVQAEDGDDDEETRRRRLLRTDYRAIQDEAVSGLAVQW